MLFKLVRLFRVCLQYFECLEYLDLPVPALCKNTNLSVLQKPERLFWKFNAIFAQSNMCTELSIYSVYSRAGFSSTHALAMNGSHILTSEIWLENPNPTYRGFQYTTMQNKQVRIRHTLRSRIASELYAEDLIERRFEAACIGSRNRVDTDKLDDKV